jgi:hypothetical protein
VPEETEDCFIDHPTRRKNMHACPDGTYVRGLKSDSGGGLLACCFERERGFTAFDKAGEELIKGSGPVVECPSMMTGINAPQKQALCREVAANPPPIVHPVKVTYDSDGPRGFRRVLGAHPSQRDAWQHAVRNWLARIHDVPVAIDAKLASGAKIDPPDYKQGCGVQNPVRGPNGITSQRIGFKSPYDGRCIAAILFFPPGYSVGAMPMPDRAADRYPAVLITHGHPVDGDANSKWIGKDETANQWASSYHATARYLAERGAITLAPDTRTFVESGIPSDCPGHNNPGSNDCHKAYTEKVPYGTFAQGSLADNMASVSILAASPVSILTAFSSQG